MEFEVFLIVGAIVALVAFLVWYFSEEQKILRALKRTPPSTIQAAASESIAKLVGRIQPAASTLESPLTRRPCVFYEVRVQQRHGKNSWSTIIHERNAVDFWIADDTGRALVRTVTIKAASVKDAEQSSGFLRDATPALEELLARHGHSSTGIVFNKTLRYSEGVFEPDETVAVLGTVRWEPDPDPKEAGTGYRDRPKRAVVEPLPDGFVLASDQSSSTH